MSEINPLNSALTRYQDPSLPVRSRSAPDSLSALASLANSQLKLPSSSSLENLEFRPSASPALALHLQNVSDMTGSRPEARRYPQITLPADADEAHHSIPASGQSEDFSWPASELPFHRAEELGDKQRDPGLTFLHKNATRMPHVAEKIYLTTVEQQNYTSNLMRICH